ncbi:MAG: ABC transporter ATP-binding protein [Roseivirga sp.]|nr:ABC transporter ATP-binding protein [Roseivirga sp.]
MKLTIENLSKTYPNGTKALNGVNLNISAGMFGLLGPNGAGKSSLMRTMVTLQEADSGTATLGEINMLKDKDELRKHIGYLPQEFGLYPKVSAEMLLNHFAALKGIHDKQERKRTVNELLEKVNLTEHRKKNLGGYSGGMKQRFGIAQALIGDPRLVIVDEPTAGLDPQERNRFHNILSKLGRETIVILSTHIVEDVKDLCTQMAILNKGSILTHGNPKQLVKDMEGQIWEKVIDQEELGQIRQSHQVISDRFYDGQTMVRIVSTSNPGVGFQPVAPGLEDVYFSHVNR